MSRALASVVLLCTVAVAGCTDPEAEPAKEECKDEALCDLDQYLQDHYCVANDLPRAYAPDVPDQQGRTDPWREGDWWEYRLSYAGVDRGTTRLVYYDIQDQGAHYMVGTPTFEEALEHAVLSTNPAIGRVHKTLYSPHESGAHADMFNFPLCDGNTWRDTFFATDFRFTAQEATLQLPGGETDAGYEIVATANDGSTLRHTYSPKAKWFTSIDLERADGLSVDLDLVDHGSGATGDAYFLRGQQDESLPIARTATTTGNSVTREAGGEGAYDYLGARLDVTRHQGDGRVELHLVGPDGQSHACVGLPGSGIGGQTECPAPPQIVSVPWQEGEWEARLSMPVLGTEASGEARVASIYDRSGAV